MPASAVAAAHAQAQLAQTHAAGAIEQLRSEYPVKALVFDYTFHDKGPFDVTAIYHDDKFTYTSRRLRRSSLFTS